MEPGKGKVTVEFTSVDDVRKKYFANSATYATKECDTVTGVTKFTISTTQEIEVGPGTRWTGHMVFEDKSVCDLTVRLCESSVWRDGYGNCEKQIVTFAVEKEPEEVKLAELPLPQPEVVIAPVALFEIEEDTFPQTIDPATEEGRIAIGELDMKLDDLSPLPEDVLGELEPESFEDPAVCTFGGPEGESEKGMFIVRQENETDEEYETRKTCMRENMQNLSGL